MHNEDNTDQSRPLVSNRTMEIVVALVLLGGAAIVIHDSARVGFGWREGEGPAPGYYPFWVAIILAVASIMNLLNAVLKQSGDDIFVTTRPFGRVLAVLIPSLVFVALIGGMSLGPVEIPRLGIYVASAIFIFFFMIVVGRENPLKAIGISVAVPLALFFLFEKWFLVPLPKGPLEAWLLGY